MENMVIEIQRLKTIANYAKAKGWTSAYVYKLARLRKIEIVKVDGIMFVKIKSDD